MQRVMLKLGVFVIGFFMLALGLLATTFFTSGTSSSDTGSPADTMIIVAAITIVLGVLALLNLVLKKYYL